MEKQTTTDHFHPVATGNRRPGIGGSRSLPHVPDTADNTNNGLATRPHIYNRANEMCTFYKRNVQKKDFFQAKLKAFNQCLNSV